MPDIVLNSTDNRDENAAVNIIKEFGLAKHPFDKKCFRHTTGAQLTLRLLFRIIKKHLFNELRLNQFLD